MEELELSKTRRKQAMQELQELGEALVELNNEKLARLNLPETLLDAVVAARKITAHGGRRRQMQYIGKLMRGVDEAPIRTQLEIWNGDQRQETAELHRLENWRKRLVEDDTALPDFLDAHPDADVQRLRTLIRNARKEATGNSPPRNNRELFRVLREILHQVPYGAGPAQDGEAK
jgi:ribosome-associated protein